VERECVVAVVWRGTVSRRTSLEVVDAAVTGAVVEILPDEVAGVGFTGVGFAEANLDGVPALVMDGRLNMLGAGVPLLFVFGDRALMVVFEKNGDDGAFTIP
jgi:hypothetical protein